MKTDNLYRGTDAQERLMKGIEKVAEAVSTTMGTAGGNAIIECIESPGHLMTNDGYTIANSIVLADPIEDMGRKILLESINRANKASGDGSSTTCILTAAILWQGSEAEGQPMEIKRSLEACIPLIEEDIKAHTRSLFKEDGSLDLAMLENVATISSEDQEIGKRIAEIYEQIGKEGIIHWDISKTADDTYTIGTGITVMGATYASPYMCDVTETGQSTNQIRIKNPQILITKQKITSAADFERIASILNGKEIKDLVVFADDFDPLVIPDLVKTRIVRGFRIVIVKMPVLWKDWWFEDLAKATGATIIDATAGVALRDVVLPHLGTVANILINKDDAYLDGIANVSEYIATLESEGSDDSKLRASRLNTKTARYFVGAQSDSALSYRRLKVEDAIAAAWQALNGGIVAGGGSCLFEVAAILPHTVGGRILEEALKAPARAIAHNAGIPDKLVSESYAGGRCLDTRTNTNVDAFEAGIVDPANIVITSVKNAVSVAATVLTTQSLVTLPRGDESSPLDNSQPLVR